MSNSDPLLRLVRLPLGIVAVTLDRRELRLEARGGFEARWATQADAEDAEVLTAEQYRQVVKAHMRRVYLELEGLEPGAVRLNLASYQLMDDLEGWCRLNAKAT